ncbi:MAG: hypothetical protein LQ345_003614 [Seirophora villosa]|nr:MAG: hypothetical protein LQ345_003614 [Seirophora villosa]
MSLILEVPSGFMDLTFDSICTFPLASDLFTLAIHTSSPVVALGLASGHVQLQRLPSLPSSPSLKAKAKAPSTNGHGTIETVWRTRRHRGSCRSLVFSADGDHLLTAGTDGILKVASTDTGEVTAKIAVPSDPSGAPDSPTLLHTLSPQTLLLATDSSALHLFDLRSDSTFISPRPQQTHHPHYDFVSSLAPLAPSDTSTSGSCRQWLSTGGSTIAITDIRKGVVYESDDFEEELLSSTVLGGAESGKIIAGGEKGFLRMWDGCIKGVINGKEKRLYVRKGECLDVLCPVPQEVVEDDMVAVGLGDGTVSFTRTGKRPGVISHVRHHDLEGVSALGFDPDGRLITGGGNTVKVWEKNTEISDGEASLIDDDQEESDEMEDGNGVVSRANGHEASEEESSDEEKPKRKKRKRNKARGRHNNNHILAFKGLD